MTFPASGIPVLSLFILALVISVYIASLRSPHRGTRYLLAGFALQATYAAVLLTTILFGLSPVLFGATYILAMALYWVLLQFCYTFLEQPLGREYHVVWWTSLIFAVVTLAIGLPLGAAILNPLYTVVSVLFAVWGVAVLLRKTILLARREEPGASVVRAIVRPSSRAARAQRALLLPVGIAFSILVVYALVQIGAVPSFVYGAWLRVALLVGLVLFAMVQFTYGLERHSVQIKLVGTALTIVLALLGIVSMIVIEPMEEPEAAILGGRMALVVLAASVVTVIAFPLAFRASLVGSIDRLLGGMRQVEAGDMSVDVPIHVHDEIGEVTRTFNGMTASLRNYATRMEGMVAERTSELEQSLLDLEQAQERLVQQEKLASLGALTAGIAHEIKNPLNFVNNFAQLTAELAHELRESLTAGSDADPAETETILIDLEQNAGKIVEHGKRADGIVRSMLMHSRGGGARWESVDINDLVTEYGNLAYHGIRAQQSGFNCDLEYDLARDLPPVQVVPPDLGRVFLNVFNNAFYASSDSAGANGRAAPCVQVRTAQVGDHVEIRIRDNGPGIPEEVRSRVFEPFFTTKPTGEGTGLGLSMSHEIVVQGHGGTMTVESAEGKGATFVITIPARTTGSGTG